MGIVQVVCGACCAVLGILLLTFNAVSLGSLSGFPIWAGIGLYLVAGILGIVAASKKSKRLVLAFMVMSIISATAAGAGVIVHSISAAIGPLFNRGGYYMSSVACDSIIALISMVELIIAIIGASMTCGALRNKQCVVQYQAAPMQVVGMNYQPQPMYTQQVPQPQYTGGPLQGVPLQGVQGAQQAGAFGGSPLPAQYTAGGEEKLPIDPPQYQTPN
ncbi:uncharacterized protein [Asterias amurensis]